jgi:hypothetical protein
LAAADATWGEPGAARAAPVGYRLSAAPFPEDAGIPSRLLISGHGDLSVSMA